MSSSESRAFVPPYTTSVEAAAILKSLDERVLELLHSAFENRLADAAIDRIEVTKSAEAGNKGVVFTIYAHGDRTQALVLWFGLDGEIEMSEDRLSARARKQLAERISIKVEALG